jgi:hypothetical protein
MRLPKSEYGLAVFIGIPEVLVPSSDSRLCLPAGAVRVCGKWKIGSLFGIPYGIISGCSGLNIIIADLGHQTRLDLTGV